MGQKIIKIGSSNGVTLPKRLLEKLRAELGDEVELEYNSRHESIEIRMANKKEEPASLFKEVAKLISEYKDEFSKLQD